MTFVYDGARVLVTGASSGIGAHLAEALAARRARLVLAARRVEKLEEVAWRCRRRGGEARVVPTDLADLEAAERLGGIALEELGGLDLLVNNAAVPRRVHVRRLTFADIDETMRVNFLGPMALTWAVLPSMLEAGSGRIVNIGSIAGRVPAPREAAYVASKFALAGMSEAMAVDLQGSGIKVHLITPGVIDTPLHGLAQEPSPYRGKMASVAQVTHAVFTALDSDEFEVFVPGRFKSVARMKAFSGEWFLRGTAWFERRNVPGAHEDDS